ncbi:hypothetical protein [Weissella viridescens]|uniref:hypothetical protein n=1 Tax=Weissella viridescens TaxID=1629 RepID=UPI003AF253B3
MVNKSFSRVNSNIDKKENTCDFEFKLNVQPDVLKKYSKNKSELFNEVIPIQIHNSFSSVFNIPKETDDNLQFVIQDDFAEIKADRNFQYIEQQTSKLINEFRQIEQNYLQNLGINYSPDYLSRLDELKVMRKQLVEVFPVLNMAQKRYKTKDIDRELKNGFHLRLDTDVHIGLDHIRKFEKIKLYVEEFSERNSGPIEILYEKKSEIFKVRSESQLDAIDISIQIQQILNQGNNQLGDVSINPIYELLVLDNSKISRRVKVVVDYPNGNVREEAQILLDTAELTDAKTVSTEFQQSDNGNNNDFLNKIKSLLFDPSNRGYLKKVESGENEVIDTKNSVVKHEGVRASDEK